MLAWKETNAIAMAASLLNKKKNDLANGIIARQILRTYAQLWDPSNKDHAVV